MYKLQFFTFIFAVLLLQNIFKIKKNGSRISTRRGLSTKEKNEVSGFTRSKVTEGSQNLKSGSRDPDHAPLGVIHVPCVVLTVAYLPKKKTKCLALPVQMLRRDPKI